MTQQESAPKGKTVRIRWGPRIWASPLEGLGFVLILLFLLGSINVFSASFVMGSQLLGDSLYFLKRHLFASFLGFAGMVWTIRQGYRWILDKVSWWSILTIVLLAAVYVAGIEANGAKRWLSIGGLTTFQPSELAKLVAVLAAAAYVGPRLDRRSVSLMSYPMLLATVMGLMVTMQPDMGTGVIIGGMCLMPYLVAGIPKRELIVLFVLGVSSTALLISRYAYRSERVWAWLNPAAYAQTSGYQPTQSLLAIGSGGLKGTGLGMGASKFYYLPEAHTDFAFAIWAQETGFVGAVVVLVLVGAMACYGVKIAMDASDGRGRILSIGVVFMIAGQAIGNTAMVVGLLPVTGVPMPFFSYGGSALIVNFLAIGLLVSVAVESARRGKTSASVQSETVSRQPKQRLTERLRRRMH